MQGFDGYPRLNNGLKDSIVLTAKIAALRYSSFNDIAAVRYSSFNYIAALRYSSFNDTQVSI